MGLVPSVEQAQVADAPAFDETLTEPDKQFDDDAKTLSITLAMTTFDGMQQTMISADEDMAAADTIAVDTIPVDTIPVDTIPVDTIAVDAKEKETAAEIINVDGELVETEEEDDIETEVYFGGFLVEIGQTTSNPVDVDWPYAAKHIFIFTAIDE